MMLYKLIIGLNDKDEGVQVVSNSKIKQLIANTFETGVVTFGDEIYLGDTNPVIIIEIQAISQAESVILEKAKKLKSLLNQDYILYSKQELLKNELI